MVPNGWSTVVVYLLGLALTKPNEVSAWSWSSSILLDRRTLLSSTIFCGSAVAGGGFARAARAACLPGDLSPNCIGVYKVPIDDNIKSMVGTKEALQKFAPDINYVPPVSSPKTKKAALEALEAQRVAAGDIASVVAAGKLEEAGIKVLNLIPKLTVSGRFLLEDAIAQNKDSGGAIAQLRQQQLETMFQTAEVAWKNVDVTIGQGLQGRMGVSAVAQLTILSEIREASAALDDFLRAVQP